MNARVIELMNAGLGIRQSYRVAKREGAIDRNLINRTPEFNELLKTVSKRTAYRRMSRLIKERLNPSTEEYAYNTGEWV